MLILDIETRANPEALAKMPPVEVKVPKTYKKQESIDRYVESETIRLTQEREDRAALDPDLGYISTIGMMDSRDPTLEWFLHDEAEGLEAAWCLLLSHEPVIGYNILGFDLPFMLRRSMAHGVVPAWLPPMRRYQNLPRDPVVDLMCILYHWERKSKSLATVARLLGLAVQPMGSGADVGTMTPEQEEEHCRADLLTTRCLFQRMDGVYWPSVL